MATIKRLRMTGRYVRSAVKNRLMTWDVNWPV